MCLYRCSFRSWRLFLVVSALLVNAAYAQTVPEPASASTQAEVVEKVDEVSIDLIASHKKKPVPDLKPDDIAVTDDGAPVKLSTLHLVTAQPGASHLITFLFDSLDPSAATNARDVAKKILKLVPAKDFSVAVFHVDSRLRLLQEFTPDRQKVQKAISVLTNEESSAGEDPAAVAEKDLTASLRSGATAASAGGNSRSLQESTLAALTDSQRIMQNQRMPASLAGLLALVRSQTRLPGRKLLVYFTEGAQNDPDLQDTVRAIAGAANRAEVSIYLINKTAVDERVMEGLMASQSMGAVAAFHHFNPGPTGPAAQQPTAFSGGLVTQVNSQVTRVQGEGLAGNGDPLSGLAISTGGSYLYSEDNLKKPFRQAFADLTTYYELQYPAPTHEYDGKFHEVKVKPLRRGLKVLSRAGYFAIPASVGVRPFEIPLLKVLAQPQLPSDVKFHAAVLQLGTLPSGNQSSLIIEVPTGALESRSNANANLVSWHVSIVSQVKDESGTVMEHFSEDVPGHSAPTSKDDARNCATMQRHFALPAGRYTLETVVQDRISGKLGATRTQFEVRDTASGPFLSDVSLVRQIDSSSEELDPFEPMRYERGKVIPGLSGQVVPGTKQLSFFFLVHPDDQVSQPAMLQMRVLRNGELLTQVPLQLPNDLTESFPYVASMKTGDLPAGNYDVLLSLTQGEKIIERENRFTIPGAELANAAVGKDTLRSGEDGTPIGDAVSGEANVAAVGRHALVITPLPKESVAQPSEDEINNILAGARTNASNYSAKLPNFMCVELTDRSEDRAGNGRWHRKDSFGELLRYADNQETRTMLEVNGQPSTLKRADMTGPISLGEFGHMLNLVFHPRSKAEFHWKETDALADGTVQVFEYRVDRGNESITLSDSNGPIYSGFHGLVYIDSSTFGIRRITMQADDLPPGFSIHAASISLDYDYVSVGEHDYLMPVRGTIRVQRGKREVDLNQIVFQNYRRYASQTKIIYKP